MPDETVGTPPAEPTPKDTSRGGTTKTKVLEVNEGTRYEVPDGFELPENIMKGLREKDKTIGGLKSRVSELEAVVKRDQEWSERVSTLFSRSEEQTVPDPIEEPDKWKQWATASIKKELADDFRRKDSLTLTTIGEMQKLHQLTGGDKEKIDRVIQHLKNRGYGLIEGDGVIHMSQGVAEDAYNVVFQKEIVEAEKEKVRAEMKAERDRIHEAVVSVAPGPVIDTSGKTWSELSPRERAERLKEDDDVPFGAGSSGPKRGERRK